MPKKIPQKISELYMSNDIRWQYCFNQFIYLYMNLQGNWNFKTTKTINCPTHGQIPVVFKFIQDLRKGEVYGVDISDLRKTVGRQ